MLGVPVMVRVPLFAKPSLIAFDWYYTCVQYRGYRRYRIHSARGEEKKCVQFPLENVNEADHLAANQIWVDLKEMCDEVQYNVKWRAIGGYVAFLVIQFDSYMVMQQHMFAV